MTVLGRREEVETLRAAVADPRVRVVLVTGDAGVGKTHLLADASGPLAAPTTVRAWGARAMAHVPLAAFAHLVDQQGGGVAVLLAALREAVPEGGVLLVDDLDQCDDLSLTLARRLAESGRCTLVGSVRTDDGVLPPAVAAFAHDAGTRTVPLAPFDRDRTDLLLADLLDGPVDAALSDEVWRRAAGNPLFIGQLVGEARSLGAIERTPSGWVLRRPLTVPVGLRQMLLARLEHVDGAGTAAARFLAAAGRLTLATVEQAGVAEGVGALHEAGIVAFERDTVRFGHPLFAEMVWDSLSPLVRRAVLREHLRLEREASTPDPVRVAVLALDAGEPTDAHGLLLAARLANAGGDVEQALRLARAAAASAEGETRGEAAALAAGVEAELGQVDAAIGTLTAALAVTPPGLAATVLAVTLHEVHLWGRFDQPAAAEVLRSERRRYTDADWWVTDSFAVAEADALTYVGRPAEAVALLDGVPERDDRFPALASMLATSRAHATTLLGRTAEAIGVASAAHEQAVSALESSVPGSRGKHLVIASHALREHGRLGEAVEHAERAHDLGLTDGLVVGRAWAALNAAAGWLQTGDLDAATMWARRSLVAASGAGMVDCERLAVSVLCVAAASRGLPVDPSWTVLLDDPPSGVGFLRHQVPIARAWVEAGHGRRAGALRILVAGVAAAAADGAVASEAWLHHERLRIGDASPAVADRLAVLGSDSPLRRARVLLARGLAARDARLLGDAGAAFADLGSPLFAAESYAAAARVSSGRERSALLRRADDLAASIGRPATPLLRGVAADPLSPRERLVAERAASGASNAEIATELSLSVRTVENHLARAYAKLGVRSRRDLARS